MDPSVTAARTAVDTYHPGNWAGVFFNVMSFDTQAAMAYIETPGATAAVVANMRASVSAQVDYIFSEDDLYRNGMPDWSYYWGSNSIRAGYGVFLVEAARLGATGTHTAAESRAHALDILHFFHGQNPMRMVYLSNMAALGGEHSVWQFYHAWFGDSWSAYSRANHIGKPPGVVEPAYPYFAGVDNHGVSDNNSSALGPAPGILVGGPNKDYGGDAQPPLGAVGFNRFYRDWASSASASPEHLGDHRELHQVPGAVRVARLRLRRPGPARRAARRSREQRRLRRQRRAGAGGDGRPWPPHGATTASSPPASRARRRPSPAPRPASTRSRMRTASYGTVPAGAVADCLATGDCYRLTVGGARPAAHWDASVRETLAAGETRDWVLHVGDSFADVPRGERLLSLRGDDAPPEGDRRVHEHHVLPAERHHPRADGGVRAGGEGGRRLRAARLHDADVQRRARRRARSADGWRSWPAAPSCPAAAAAPSAPRRR